MMTFFIPGLYCKFNKKNEVFLSLQITDKDVNYYICLADKLKTMNIVVTGASRGIGYEAVKMLASDGNRVFAIARNKDGLRKLFAECGGNKNTDHIHVLPFDLSDGDFNGVLLPAILHKMEKVDILVNNAGLLINKPFEMMEDMDFEHLFRVNVRSVFELTRCLLPHFATPAHIVNIGSMGGCQGSSKFPGLALYSASKGAVAVLTECMAEEFKPRRISVNCLALGSAQTEMLSEAFPGYKAPLTAGEMAAFIADFALNGHRWFNGKIIPVSLATP
jgi:NAD(P)-dependent dehydrogenase (short-subunit alcohol dehydrogenase family)